MGPPPEAADSVSVAMTSKPANSDSTSSGGGALGDAGSREVVPKAADGHDKSEPGGVVPYLKLYSTADKLDLLLIALGLLGAMGAGIMLPLFSIVFGDFVDAFGDPNSVTNFSQTTSDLALKFLYLAIGAFVAMWLEVTCFTLAGERQTNRLRQRFLAAVLAQDIAWFDTAATTGGLLQGLNEDSINVQAAISEKASNFVHHLSTFTAGYIIGFTKGWDMTLVMLGCLPFLAIMGSFIARLSTSGTQANQVAYAQASTIAQQSISNVRTVVAYNGQDSAIASYEEALIKPIKVGFKASGMVGVALGGLQAVMYWAYAVALFYGAYRVVAGKYTGGQVIEVLLATLMGSFALGQAAPNLEKFASGRVSGYKMFSVIERVGGMHDVGKDVDTASGQGVARRTNSNTSKPASRASGDSSRAVVLAPHNGTGTLDKVVGAVALRDVYFAYPARPDVQVFKGFTLDVPAGQTVALVGSSGSGKSTAVQLIERFYDPESGSVTLDCVDLRALTLKFLRSQIGLVSQEPTLFATTIYDNIAIGRPGATKHEVEAAAAAANAHKFISALPEGYKTQVGERGVQLSGGQKQRIAIARAVLKNPRVLLLDEATSALDTQSERVVQAALDRMVLGRTTVVVAHRLSTIRNADAIAVVSAGTVVEKGTHDELLAKPNGAYAILVQMQMQAAKQVEEAGESSGMQEEAVDSEDDEGVQIATGVEANQGEGPGSHAGRLASTAASGVPPVSISPATSAQPHQAIELAAAGPRGSAGGGSGTLEKVVVNPQGSVTAQRVGSVDLKDHHSTNAAVKALEEKQREKDREKADEEAGKQVPMARLLALNKPEWPALVAGCIGSIGAGVQHPAMAFVLSDMIGVFFLTDFDELKQQASFYAWMFFVIGCGALLMVSLQQVCFGYAGSRLALRVRVMLLRHLLRQEVAFFDQDENSSGRLTSMLATDAAYVRGAVGDATGVLLQNLSTLGLGYLIALAYNWQMALLITGTLPILMVAAVLQMRWATGASSTSDTLYAAANQYVGEAFASIRVIHAYNLQGYITGMYEGMLASTRPVLNKQAHIGGLGMGFSFCSIFGLYGLIVYFGGWQLENGKTDFEGFLKGFLAILLAAMGMAQAGVAFPDLGKARGAVGRIFPLLDRQTKIDPEAPGEEKPHDQVKGEVEFQAINFAYPSRPSVLIYSDFSLRIPAGKVYALVGESGSGKSTVVSLLERFYSPTSGQVLLDGVDITTYQLKWLRQQIGLVSQEPVLFAGTVETNIAYGAPGVSIEEVEAAARVANAHEFVDKLPEGYKTKIGDGGIQLSGGQKQRIAIARAVLKNPRVLLLDEATSALDARSERVVQDALDVVMQGRTCLVIAHRLSTIRNADAISVLYRGVVLEQGSHEQLMAIPGGAYAKLVAAQESSQAKA